ncbi:MAG TPA: RNA polymerase factor sigma-54 [Xanthomonadaceae bacterium]|jgi:RNA polymerase sigma-54 factor|nr:RNA polymerase factor sigma-54 [Xanthomonadaceae bacterium]
MKASLSTKLGQQLTLTPQLRQAIHLLTLSAAELESEINIALEGNPLLERVEDGSNGDDAPASDTSPPETANNDADAADAQAAHEGSADEPPDWDTDFTRNTDSRSGTPSDDSELEPAAAPEGLHDHLLWQLHLTPLSARERGIGAALIDAVSDDGYLTETLDAIRDGLLPEIHATLDEIATVLHRIQRFDPVGVACSNLAECLSVQLSVLSPDTPGLRLAQRIAAACLEDLARLGADQLARHLGESQDAVREAVALVRSLDPRPGGQIASAAPDYVLPDCVAYRHGGEWKVALVGGQSPALTISRHYEGLIGKANRDDSTYLRSRLQEARWLIKSLQTRADTVLRVAQAIVRQQSSFLEFGPEAMRPLTLREVAEELGLHESTISRTTTRKFLHTPRGTFEFKRFFASGISNETGGAASSTAIQAMIRRLVEAENPRKPLSDARLAAELKTGGVPVARRTVAKYRELLRIPPSNERQRL